MHAPRARTLLLRCAFEILGAHEVPEGRYGELKWIVEACQSFWRLIRVLWTNLSSQKGKKGTSDYRIRASTFCGLKTCRSNWR